MTTSISPVELITLLLGEYYFLKQRLPIFFYLIYKHFDKEEYHSRLDTLTDIITQLLSIILMYTMIGYFLEKPFIDVIPFYWNHQGLITWGIFFFFNYRLYLHSEAHAMTKFKALTLSILATVGGGWLYEIPFYNPPTMFLLHNSLFYLNGQIICLLLLFYELKKMNYKHNKLVSFFTVIFILSSALLFDNYEKITYFYAWLVRIPTCFLLTSLISGIDQNE